jgi:hypothetical protein
VTIIAALIFERGRFSCLFAAFIDSPLRSHRITLLQSIPRLQRRARNPIGRQ